jgi:hypothetical protein
VPEIDPPRPQTQTRTAPMAPGPTEHGPPPGLPEVPTSSSEADPAAKLRARLARPGYAYLRAFADPVLAQLARTAAPAERQKLLGRIEAMFAVSHSPDGFGLTDVKQASNRYHAELGAAAIQELRALPQASEPAVARSQAQTAARGIEQRTDQRLEDDVHLTIALGEGQDGHIEGRARIAPNVWEWIGLVVAYGLAGGAAYLLQPAPLELLPVGPADPERTRTALDRRGGARGAAQAGQVLQAARAAFDTAAVDALGEDVEVEGARDERTVTPPDRDPFVVRLEACALGSQVVRAVVNPSKIHILQLSDRAADRDIPRAVAGALAEIAARVQLAAEGEPLDRADTLRAGGPEGGALSPRDRAAIAQLESLCRTLDTTQGPAQRRPVYADLHVLLDDLGLRASTAGHAARRAAIQASLSDTARTWVTELGKVPAQLGPTYGRALVDAQAEEETARVADQKRRAREAPLHQAPRQHARITPTGAAELARMAAARRRARSEQMVQKYSGLAASASPGYHRVESPQIGGGATLTAIRPNQLLIDDAGRWQRDLSENLAQTAAQLRWVRDAGLGDPFEFVDDPGDRVPLDAVRYWQDTLAAQADVIDGRAQVSVDGQGRMLLRVHPTQGAQIILEIGGNGVVGTGFPPENIPRPREPSPASAKATLLGALNGIGTPLALGVHGQLNGVIPTNDTQVIQFVTTANAGVLGQLRAHANPAVVAAMAVLDAPAAWQQHHQPAAPKPRVLTGDEANTDTLDPAAAHDWVITGVGGTGISAAEIILDRNRAARVTMLGGNATPGLFDNVQARRVMALYGPTGDRRFQVITGQNVGGLVTPDGGATFDLGSIAGHEHLTAAPPNLHQLARHRRWLVNADRALLPALRHILELDVGDELLHARQAPFERVLVTLVGNQIPDDLRDDPEFEDLLQEFGPVSGTIRLQVATGYGYGNVAANAAGAVRTGWNPQGGVTTGALTVDGYIAAIGRRGQSSPIITQLIQSAQGAGHAVAGRLLWDADQHYTGYQITITAVGQPPRSIDVTGAASRFLPIPPFGAADQQEVTRVGTADAPPESGNFDGGFSASALQAQAYARQRRADSEHAQLTTLRLDGAMGTLTLPANEDRPRWEQRVKDFLVAELRVPGDRVEVRLLMAGASGAAVFRVTVGASQRIFKIFDDQYGAAQNELAQLQFLANLHLQEFQPVQGQQGRLPAQVNGQGQRTGILMESAEGSSIEDLLERLPARNTAMRVPAIQRIQHAAERVATALAEFHQATARGGNLNQNQKSGNGSDAANIRNNKLPALQNDLAPDYAQILAAFNQAVTRYENAPVPATAYHGDANAGNFILDAEDSVHVIDVGYMQWSHQGNVGTSTGANDLARFITSLETLKPGALDGGEVAQIRGVFTTAYYEQCRLRGLAVDANNMADAIKIYRVETEIAVMRGAIRKLGNNPDPQALANAQHAGRDRIKGVLGL